MRTHLVHDFRIERMEGALSVILPGQRTIAGDRLIDLRHDRADRFPIGGVAPVEQRLVPVDRARIVAVDERALARLFGIEIG